MAAAVKTTLDPLYEMNEACDRLRCARPTVYRLDDAGEVTLIKIRGKTLVAGVEQLIARQLEAASLGRLRQDRLEKEAAGQIAVRGIDIDEHPPPGAIPVSQRPENAGRTWRGRTRQDRLAQEATGPPSRAAALSDEA